MSNVSELQAQLNELEQKKAQLFEQPSVDQVEVRRINEQIKEIEKQLAEKFSLEQHEERMEQAAVQITHTIESIDIGEGERLPLRDLVTSEQAYQLLLVHFNTAFVGQAEQFSKQILTTEESYQGQLQANTEAQNQLQYQIAQLQQRNADLTTQLNQVEAERDNAKADLEDARTKLANAAAEIERLNSQVDDLRKEIAVGAREAVKVVDTNLTANYAKAVQEFKNSRPAIYNMHPLDNLGKRFGGYLLETDEFIKFGFLEKGKYREVSAEEAARFREERAARGEEVKTEPAAEVIPNPPLDVTPPALDSSFRPEETDIPGIADESADGSLVPQTLEQLSEEIIELKRRVDRLEGSRIVEVA
ncbi:hypothetical protein DNH61_11715 [Paenibacillus sambharensis]|uniref:Uncharacterized protein n=1 Tax=Paenibacillus sambharensis TaxID=1803190 RepID=A0A2W1LAQ8_9BACL|nr:hypothetical protein [Paenibacillus sambharensis]PZD95220.1 hypothetical protein DNH61_11715 [Paenibacillus sambharensis]